MRATGLIALVFLAGVALPAHADPAAEARFKALYTREWTWREQQFSDDEDSAGSKIKPHLPDVSAATQAERLKVWAAARAELDTIPATSLSAESQVDRGIYAAQLDAMIAGQRFRDWEMPANPDSSFWSNLAGGGVRSFVREQDYRNWIVRMREIPRYFAQHTDNMRAGLARGLTPPKVTMAGRDSGVAAVAEAAAPEATAFYKPFLSMPASIPAATQAALRADAAAAIRDAVIPAHRTLLKFLHETYLPGLRTTLAAYDLPDGRAYYAAQIRQYTTLDLTPEAIHAIGEAEVAKIRAQMLGVMAETGFKGDLPAFLAFLRSDPQFYVKTPQALLDRAAWTAKKFDNVAAKWFGHLPRARFGIVPVAPEIAPFYTAGRGGTGVYLLNTYDLPSRPLYALPALTLHESAPGHAFQIPLAAEAEGQPAFRSKSYISAYGEGWALYCEKLGVEMGMYETPYERFGMLSYQMWRAARLVVDTGIHAQGWSRERALQYFRDNAALSEREITTEVDRYIGWPGQALSYYLGELAILDGRAKAEKALGPKFDVRAFHDTVLALGSVPLPVLSARIDRFIAEEGRGPYKLP